MRNQAKDTKTQLVDHDCHLCNKSFRIADMVKVTNEETWNLLEKGAILDVECPNCGYVVTIDRMITFAIHEWAIGELQYIPLHTLNSDDACEFLLGDGRYQETFYSIEELILQVNARVRVMDYLFTEMADHREYIQQRWSHFSLDK